ncbi:hypothetical protein EDB80DRAFT_382364 [Ilyonectria destructans]|nr:hypothetical protein EDB80DRAFT_382364 [Ilyonectria destructans]
MVFIARARDIMGPYESYEHNPTIKPCSADRFIQHPSYGGLFYNMRGEHFVVCLGVRKDRDSLMGYGMGDVFVSSKLALG